MVNPHRFLSPAMFSPDGKRVLTPGFRLYNHGTDPCPAIYDANTGERRISLRAADREAVNSHLVAFSPDGQWVLTASWDRTARLWDARTGKEVATLRSPGQALWSATFSADGREVLTVFGDRPGFAASTDYSARLWPVDVLAAVVRRKPRDLTPDERKRFEVATPDQP